MTPIAQEIARYREHFNAFEKKLNGKNQNPIGQIRRVALQRFADLGFPTLKDEEWRFTNISAITQTDFRLASDHPTAPADLLDTYLIEPANIPTLVFVNGFFRPDLSTKQKSRSDFVFEPLSVELDDPDSAANQHLARFAALDTSFTALNTAFLREGALIHVGKNVVVKEPLHILHLAVAEPEPAMIHPRNLIVLDDSAQLTLIESYVGSDGVYLNNPVTEIILGENASLEHHKIQVESMTGYHVAMQHVQQRRNSNFISHSFSFGGAIVRNNLVNVLDGQGSECVLNGLYLAHGTQLVDNHSLIDHAMPHCHSRELYKGILDQESRAVFTGRIRVRKDAQKTDAIQSNQNLLLSADATIDSKPQLEIYADDVRCTHGGTVGQIDQDQIFYLRSRGVPLPDAQNILVHAFAGGITERVKMTGLQQILDAMVIQRLHDGHITK